MANANKITVTYENGTVKELKKGIAAEFDSDNMSVEMLNVAKLDLVRITYGMIMTVQKTGLMPYLEDFMRGNGLPDEADDEFDDEIDD